MKTIETMAAQGDVLFRRIDVVPIGARPQKGERHVVAHSETGHHHEAYGDGPPVCYFTTDDPMLSYLSCGAGGIVVEHLRPTDTHDPIRLAPGCWEVRRQREHVPEGWRMVMD